MSSTNYLLSRYSNVNQLTLQPLTRDKFIASAIINKTDDEGFDQLTLPDNIYLKIDYPNCIFNKIPNKLNTQAFLQYLGLKSDYATQLFIDTSLKMHGVLDGEALLNQLKSFAKGLTNPLDGLSFYADLISDVNRTIYSASQVPARMNGYLAKTIPSRTFDQLTKLDYLFKVFSDRIANLVCLDRAIEQFRREYLIKK